MSLEVETVRTGDGIITRAELMRDDTPTDGATAECTTTDDTTEDRCCCEKAGCSAVLPR